MIQNEVPYAELYHIAEEAFVRADEREVGVMCMAAANEYNVDYKKVYNLVRAMYDREFG